MKIGLIDVDGHGFPNLPLMKISAFHKSIGDTVEWYSPLVSGHCDKVYVSKVFSFSSEYNWIIDADEIIRGGSGYCIKTENGVEKYDKVAIEALKSEGCDGCRYNTRTPQERCLRCKRYWRDSYERKGGDTE